MDTQIYPAKEDCPKILNTKRESRGRKEKKKRKKETTPVTIRS